LFPIELTSRNNCLPCGLFPFGVFPTMGSHKSLRVPAPGSGAFPAFHTLTRPSSAHCLPALFHAGPAHGVHPSGPISTRRAVQSFDRPTLLGLAHLASSCSKSPLLPLSPRIRTSSSMTTHNEAASNSARPTSGSRSRRVSVPSAGGLDQTESRDPPGLYLLRVSHLLASGSP
jgi:hypothetical protein